MAKTETHLQILVCSQTHINTQACLYVRTHFFMFFFFNHHSLFFITNKKPQTTTFLIKFLWALFCLTTPSLKNYWLTFLTVFLFSGSEKSVGPFPRLCVCRFFFFVCWPWWRLVDVLTSLTDVYFLKWHHTPDPIGGSERVGGVWFPCNSLPLKTKQWFAPYFNCILIFSKRNSKTVLVVGFLLLVVWVMNCSFTYVLNFCRLYCKFFFFSLPIFKWGNWPLFG